MKQRNLVVMLFTVVLMHTMCVFAENENPMSVSLKQDMRKDSKWYRYDIEMKWYEQSPALEKECIAFFFGQNNNTSTLSDCLKQFLGSFDKRKDYGSSKSKDQSLFRLAIKTTKHGKYQCYYLKKKITREFLSQNVEKNIVYDAERDCILTIDDVLTPAYADEVKKKANGQFINMLMNDKVFVWGIGSGDNLKSEQIAISELTYTKFTKQMIHLIGLEETVERIERDKKLKEEALARKEAEEARLALLRKGLCDLPEVEPSFPGGKQALYDWVKNHVTYPSVAEQAGMTADVGCTFIVGTDGSVIDVKAYRSSYHPDIKSSQNYIEHALDNAAVAALEKMPKWKPGKMKNDTVAVRRYVTVHVNRLGGAEGLDVAPWVEKESDVAQKALAAKKSGKTSAAKKSNPAVKKVASSMSFATPDINSDEIGETSTKIGTFDVRGVEDTSGEVLKAKEVIADEKPSADQVKVFDVVEQMPEFPGGQPALLKWIADNIKYPTIAEENGIQGRVVCTFIVERDGSITDVQVARSIDPSLDAEAMRVLRKMPKWKPAMHKGQAVRVKYTVPVTFKLQ